MKFWAACLGDVLSLGSLHEICRDRDRERVSIQLLGSCLQSSVMVQ